MKDEEFYDQCAKLLSTEYACEGFPYLYRTRWNNRAPGNGRYPGFGIVRLHGENVHVALRHPICVNQQIHGRRQALEWLSTALAISKND